ALERYLMTRSQAQAIWHKSGDEVRRMLLGTTALNRRSYKPETLERWFDDLDELFSTDGRSLHNFTDAVQRLSRSTLVECTNSGRPTPEHKFFEACEWLWAAHAQASTAFDGWLTHFKGRLVAYARAEARRRKLEGRLVSFDDLLQKMSEALAGPHGEVLAKRIRRKYPAALIDEFQDTDPIQYAVFSRIYGKQQSSLFLIGDPKQAIYAFRGADIFAYLKAANDAGANTWTLSTNYRSDRSLVRALNTLFRRPWRPFLLDGISYVEVTPRPGATDALQQPGVPDSERRLEILFVERAKLGIGQRAINRRFSDQCLPDWIAADIARLLASGARIGGEMIRPNDIAVLTRTNQQAHEMGHALRRLRIPSALIGDTSVFDTKEAAEMRLLMRAMADPQSGGALRSALCTPSMGVSASELAELASDEAAWERWVDAFRHLHELWETRGFVHAMQTLMREREVSARALALLDGERRMTNLRHLTELLHQAEANQHLGVSGLSSWFDEVVFNPAAREGLAPDTLQIRLESDDHAVRLTTMHKSKGLEYPVVYCPYLWRDANLFQQDTKNLKVHDESGAHQLRLDLRPVDAKSAALASAQRESLAEHLRLAYVALTRARHRTVVVWGAFGRAEDSPLGYLLYQPSEELGALSETPAGRIAKMSDSELLRGLGELERSSEGAISVRTLEPEPAPEYLRASAAPEQLLARPLTRPIDRSQRTTSFSQLTQHHERETLVASLGKDVDDVLPNDPPTPPDALGDTVSLAEFPKGARTGELLHAILEHADFTSPASLEAQVALEFQRYGVASDEWAGVVCEALTSVLETKLPGADDLRLSKVTAKRRVSEMEFTLPLGRAPRPSSSERRTLLSSARLAAVFERHAPELGAPYLERVKSLGFSPLSGFLRGFIDLVFEHDGRFFVVDFKSNHLGVHASDYAPPLLRAPMAEHHYYLQYHLYVTALHRHLGARRPNYDYDRDFGGVHYLFLRGMAPRHPSGTGVFFDRPARALIEALSALFEGEQEPASPAATPGSTAAHERLSSMPGGLA
ncbi:MAG TPA: exodeoxyribonuclease V subunit beta, partial [Polyangiaceae bacterium]|nr:exodeoxyribonuclease V subunit beta [Polyangiaceae bacterium]